MKILLICGSIAEKSHTNALLKYIEELFKDENVETEFWDLKERELPIALPQYHKDPTLHPDTVIKEFVSSVENEDAIILGSPLYHGSYSGVLKNALDNLHWDAFRNKWVGFVGNAGSSRASHTQLVHLRQVVNTLVGYSVQTQVGTSGHDYDETENKYILIDEGIKERCQRFVKEVISCVSK